MLDELLATQRLVAHDLATFVDGLDPCADRSPIDRALLGGAQADRLGYAFVAGYQSALASLLPRHAHPAALCVSESGRPHPARIATRWDGSTVSGVKSYVSAGPLAQTLWVLASAGQDGDRNVLVLVPVAADGPGLTWEAKPDLPFAPEVPHTAITLSECPSVGPVVEDAWSEVVVPFRTVEDTFVLAAAVGYRIGAARLANASPQALDRLLAAAFALRALAAEDPKSPLTHRALAGLDPLIGEAFEDAPLPDDEASRWERDRPLLDIASTARRARLEKAWARS